MGSLVQFSRLSLVAFILSTMSFVQAHAQNCTALDARTDIEKLDCFCNPNEVSPAQKRLEALGPVAELFHLNGPFSCVRAVLSEFVLSGDGNAEARVQNRLTALGYSNAQISPIIEEAKSRYLAIKSFSIGRRNVGIQLDTFMIELILELQLGGSNLSLRNLGASPVSKDLIKLDKVSQIATIYPYDRIQGCVKITDSVDDIGSCLKSPAGLDTIAACSELNTLTSSKLSCVQINPSVAQIRACNDLNMISSSFLSCAQLKAPPETIKACGQLNMIASSTLQCIEIGAPDRKIEACGGLNMIASSTIQCLSSSASVEVVEACGELNMIGSSTIQCLNSGADVNKIRSCGAQNLIASKTIACLRN